MEIKKNITFLLWGCLLFSLSSCGLFYKDDSEDDYNLYIIGQRSQIEGEYRDAKKVYEKLLQEYPSSNLRAKAILGLADAEFNNGDYLEAEFEYQKFTELYPSHEHVAKAYFYKGMSHYMQMVDVDRDTTQTEEAFDTFTYLLDNFPASPYVAEATIKKEECRVRLGKSIMNIAKFYYQTGAYGSAILRCIEYISGYSDGEDVDYALYILGDSYLNETNTKKAKIWFQKLVDNFPDSDYLGKAKSQIEDVERSSKK